MFRTWAFFGIVAQVMVVKQIHIPCYLSVSQATHTGDKKNIRMQCIFITEPLFLGVVFLGTLGSIHQHSP